MCRRKRDCMKNKYYLERLMISLLASAVLMSCRQENYILTVIGEQVGLTMKHHDVLGTIAGGILWFLAFILPLVVGGLSGSLFAWIVRFWQNEPRERILMARRAAEYVIGFQLVFVSFWPLYLLFPYHPALVLLFIVGLVQCLWTSPALFKGLLTRAEAKQA